MKHLAAVSSVAAAGLLLSATSSSQDPATATGNWPQWRGPEGTGMAQGDAPTTWSSTENVKWRVDIPGRGCSTPVIWGDRIFLTTAVPTGKEPEPEEQPQEDRRRGSFHGGGGPQVEHSFDVLCLDRSNGEILWHETAIVTTPHEGHHGTYGSHASNSPVTDGEYLFAFFGSRGLFCYDMQGDLAWKKDFGVKMRMRVGFGEGVAVVLHGDALILDFDHEGDSFIVAIDKRSGEELWRTRRDEGTSWAPPLVVKHDGRKQVVVSATSRVRGYDFATGELIWECGGLGSNAIPAPLQWEDTVLAMTGHRSPKLMAIRLGGEGDLTGKDAVVWSTSRGTSYTPSPLLHDGRYFALMDKGFLSCFDAATGEPHYVQERLPRGTNFKASPVGAKGKLYLASESGDVLVLKMGDEFELITVNELEGEVFISSPAIAGGEIFLRSLERVYCIAETLPK